MTARTEQQRAILVTEWSIVWIGSDGIGARLLLRERDIVLDAVALCILVNLLCYHLLEEFQVVVRNGEMNVCLAVAASIERSLNQVLLHWGANLVLILVELEQSLRQLSVVQSLWLEEISHDSLVIALLDKAHNALLVVYMALIAECLAESKLLDILEELFFEVSSRNIVWSIQERKHVLEHTASRT